MEWVIVCNPNYYDIESAFKNMNFIDWHQNIKEYIKDEKETETEEHKNNPSDFKAPPAPKI